MMKKILTQLKTYKLKSTLYTIINNNDNSTDTPKKLI